MLDYGKSNINKITWNGIAINRGIELQNGCITESIILNTGSSKGTAIAVTIGPFDYLLEVQLFRELNALVLPGMHARSE